VQFTGLTSVVLTDWVERLRLDGLNLPSFADEWKRWLAWTEVGGCVPPRTPARAWLHVPLREVPSARGPPHQVLNVDLTAISRLFAFVPGEAISDLRLRMATTLAAVPFSTLYLVLTAIVPLFISFFILVIYKPVGSSVVV
jgi:hypothetical protein